MIILPEKYKTLLANKIYQAVFTSEVNVFDDDFNLTYEDDKFKISLTYYILIDLKNIEENPDSYDFDIYDDFKVFESDKDISDEIDFDDLYDSISSKLDNLIINGKYSNNHNKDYKEKPHKKFKDEY